MEDKSQSRKNLYFSVFSASSLLLGVGVFLGWPSPALVLLQSQNYTSLQTSLLASLPGIAPGPLLSMFGINLIGRKNTLLVIWSTLITSWIIMWISLNINTLLVARFIGGWGMSASFTAIGIYISEISDVPVRGALNSASILFYSVGTVVISCVGPFTSLQVITVTSAAVTFIFLLFFWFIPESPYYHVYKGQHDKALSTLTWLRGNVHINDIEDELKKIQYSIEEEKKDKAGIRKLFTSKVVLQQFGFAFYLLFVLQVSGLGPLTSFSQTIFESANLKFNAAFVPIALNTFTLFAGLPSPFLVKKYGNKVIFIVCTFACSIAHALLALYFFLLEGDYNVQYITWLPIFGMFLLLFAIFVGLTPIIWGFIADLFAPSVKGYATGICGIFSTLIGFISSTVFGLSKDAYNFGLTFLGFSILLLLATIGLFFVPKMTHMSLQEIQDYFETKPRNPENQEISYVD